MINEKQQNKIYEEMKTHERYKDVCRRIIGDNMKIVEIILPVVYYSDIDTISKIAKNNDAIFLIEPVANFYLKVVLH
jgi:hypothetical protein